MGSRSGFKIPAIFSVDRRSLIPYQEELVQSEFRVVHHAHHKLGFQEVVRPFPTLKRHSTSRWLCGRSLSRAAVQRRGRPRTTRPMLPSESSKVSDRLRFQSRHSLATKPELLRTQMQVLYNTVAATSLLTNSITSLSFNPQSPFLVLRCSVSLYATCTPSELRQKSAPSRNHGQSEGP